MVASHRNLWADYPAPEPLPPVVVSDPSWPLVSIVTPSYNQGRFIRETIESVLTQDYPNIEYWVIDGGSTDETVSILCEYESDPRFHWLSERDEGQSDAINKGWSRCQGDILAWLNSDDTYIPGAIRSQISFLESHASVDIVYGKAITVDTSGQYLGMLATRPFSQYELLRLCYIPQPTVFLRRQTIERTGPVDVSFHYTMDYDYWLRASLNCVFAYNPEMIAAFRLHQESKTVASAVRFNSESERAVRRYFQHDSVPALLQRRRNQICADLMLRLSIDYAWSNDHAHALRYLYKSFAYHPLRPRLFWSLLAILDLTGEKTASRHLTEAWNRFITKEA